MIAIIYRFHLRPEQEATYKDCWQTVANHFTKERGAIGSCLHKGDDGLWVVYSRWPSEAVRRASWPKENQQTDERLPETVKQAIAKMQAIKATNKDLPQYEEINLEVMGDKLN